MDKLSFYEMYMYIANSATISSAQDSCSGPWDQSHGSRSSQQAMDATDVEKMVLSAINLLPIAGSHRSCFLISCASLNHYGCMLHTVAADSKAGQ